MQLAMQTCSISPRPFHFFLLFIKQNVKKLELTEIYFHFQMPCKLYYKHCNAPKFAALAFNHQ